MEAIAGSKVLFLNSNALSKSFIRYHHHHHHHRFVCYLQSRGNQKLKLVTSQETHIVKPVLNAVTPKPKPKPKHKLVHLLLAGLSLTAISGVLLIEFVILPKKHDSVVSLTSNGNSIVCCSSYEDINYAYTSGECEFLPGVMLYLTLQLMVIHEEETLRNRKNVALRVIGLIIICVFFGCWLRLMSLARVKDNLLAACGHGPWHLTLTVLSIVSFVSAFGASAIQDIRQLEDRVNTQICVGSGAQVGDLESRKLSRRPHKKSMRRNNIAEQTSRLCKRSRRPRKKSDRGETIVLNKDLGKTTPVVEVFG